MKTNDISFAALWVLAYALMVFSIDVALLPPYHKAEAKILSQSINGTVTFVQGGPESSVVITAYFSGLTPGQQGFHIHETPVTTSCDSTGGHFNPYNSTHGAWNSSLRHFGDIQALVANDQGIANYTYTDPFIKLDGPTSVVGRAIVVHAKSDDFGLGGDVNSTKSGNAGARLVCANITAV